MEDTSAAAESVAGPPLEEAYKEAIKIAVLMRVLGGLEEDASSDELDWIQSECSYINERTTSVMENFVKAKSSLTQETKAKLSDEAFDELEAHIIKRHAEVKGRLDERMRQLAEEGYETAQGRRGDPLEMRMLSRFVEVVKKETGELQKEEQMLGKIKMGFDSEKLKKMQSGVTFFACSDSRLNKTSAAGAVFLALLANNRPDLLEGLFSAEESKDIREGKVSRETLGRACLGDFGGMIVNAGAVAKPELAGSGDAIVIAHEGCGAHRLGELKGEILSWLHERGYALEALGVSESDFSSIPEPEQHAREQVQRLVDANPKRGVVGVVVNFETGTAKVVASHNVKMPVEVEIPDQKIEGELLESQAPMGIAIGGKDVDLHKEVGAGPGEYFAVTDDGSTNSEVSLIYAVAHLNSGSNIQEVVFVARKESEANALMGKWRANPLFMDLEKSGVRFLAKVAAGS